MIHSCTCRESGTRMGTGVELQVGASDDGAMETRRCGVAQPEVVVSSRRHWLNWVQHGLCDVCVCLRRVCNIMKRQRDTTRTKYLFGNVSSANSLRDGAGNVNETVSPFEKGTYDSHRPGGSALKVVPTRRMRVGKHGPRTVEVPLPPPRVPKARLLTVTYV